MLGFIMVILVAIPFSVYVAQQRQQTKSKASASTTLSFEPASTTVKTGDNVILNIMLDPGTGTSANQVSFVKLSINFDAAKFAILSGNPSLSLKPADSPNTLTTIIEDPKYESGKATISLSIGADPTKAVVTKTKIAILQLKATDITVPTNPNITFDSAPNTQVLSIASGDQTSENVLSTTIPATVTITSAITSTAPTSTPTPTPTTVTKLSTTTTTTAPSTQNMGTTNAGSGTGTIAAELSPIVIQNLFPSPTFVPTDTKGDLPPTGDGNIMFDLGTLGVILTIIGGALLLL